jgi:hypothetical protein
MWKSEQLTNRYDPLCRAYVGRVIVKSLDPYYKTITFLQSGDYDVDGSTVRVTSRAAVPLVVGRAASQAA